MIAAFLALPIPALAIQVDPRMGLSLTADGVPLVRGSYLQVYEPDWSKGYYTSFNSPMDVRPRGDGGFDARFQGPEGQVEGTVAYDREPDGVRVRLRIHWKGEKPARAEWCAGLVWLPAFRGGTVASQPLAANAPQGKTLEERRLGADASNWTFDGALGTLTARASAPSTAFDARGYDQPWAAGGAVAWVGQLALDLAPGQWTEAEHRWTFRGEAVPGPRSESLMLAAHRTERAVGPPSGRPPLIPTPKSATLDWDATVPFDGTPIRELLRLRWLTVPTGGTRIRARTADLGLPAEGYEVHIAAASIELVGQDPAGLAHARRTLAKLAFPKDGRLVVPKGTVRDWPSSPWRGVHLFAGPTALSFQKKLWTQALLDLGFNKAVIQCERTAWKSLPGTETSITMPRDDLAALFGWYRSQGVEPIPLVQSFGHMEWFFANGQNRDAMFNPDVPYSVDPRRPATREKLGRLWDEIAALLQPKTFHFGLDEVDMRGWPVDPELVTKLWEMQLPFLGSIAKKHGARMMLWGDKGLAPGQAVDATHGSSVEQAARRRAAIPHGAWITDWHYRADPNPATFAPSLDLWSGEGLHPVASTWYRPENVRGFGAAAAQRSMGVLQTTWAGYESSEAAMLRQFHQFTVMALTAEVAWTGSEAPPPWSFDEVFTRLMYGRPQPIRDQGGYVFGDGPERTVAGVAMRALDVSLRGLLSPATRAAPTEVRISLGGTGPRLALGLACDEASEEGEAIGELAVSGHNYPLLYGRHVRAEGDPGATAFAPRDGRTSVLVVEVPEGPLRMELRALNPASGLRLLGVTRF